MTINQFRERLIGGILVPLVWDADWMSMGQVHESSLAGERRDCNVELYFCYYHINMLGVAGTTDASTWTAA